MGVLTAWAGAAVIQIYRDVVHFGQAPLPSEFVASGAIFGLLSIPSGGIARPAGFVAWGILLAIILQAGGPSKLISQGSALPVAKAVFPAPSTTTTQAAGQTKAQAATTPAPRLPHQGVTT
jgi:hypothetical protein